MTTFNRWVRWVHIYSAAPILLLMLFFAITGFFLNHVGWSVGKTQASDQTVLIPESLMELDWEQAPNATALMMFHWLDQSHQVRGVELSFEWEIEEQLFLLYLDGPQGNYVVEAYRDEASADIYKRQFPVLEMLNNLHRGKHVSGLWILLSDIAAFFMVLFCLSGSWLLVINTLQRRQSLSWVGIGAAVMILTIYLMH
ncbi:PepSY-associated TM helix domain-containing protein [Marinomonas sp. 2405UD66-6]|uniref:PepSY-associated TM helix domain-containing protein n=1 Tax=Marinomonas sp. 2405UD66-6 TaxID=3391834 RepID=UPI0039C9CA80